jgi:hypothetical protein
MCNENYGSQENVNFWLYCLVKELYENVKSA